jgi:hypothetical protein
MLSQNSIPTRPPRATELVAGTHELVAELEERLRAGESFDNPKLTEIADKSFSGNSCTRQVHITRRLRRFRNRGQ